MTMLHLASIHSSFRFFYILHIKISPGSVSLHTKRFSPNGRHPLFAPRALHSSSSTLISTFRTPPLYLPGAIIAFLKRRGIKGLHRRRAPHANFHNPANNVASCFSAQLRVLVLTRRRFLRRFLFLDFRIVSAATSPRPRRLGRPDFSDLIFFGSERKKIFGSEAPKRLPPR
ncbi:hypothetical protein L596_027800 [Steinernema carpocapsae]|uniref:Uncharacterized protein n=1 Tax=Steinernema carpocapsae TaxID=34508 RepID=A0A4U5LWL2_STECR|nr:hypothetical protein L596_027800 [Steinernema carpocapsae]